MVVGVVAVLVVVVIVVVVGGHHARDGAGDADSQGASKCGATRTPSAPAAAAPGPSIAALSSA